MNTQLPVAPVKPIPESGPPLQTKVLINAASWVRRFSQLLGTFLPEDQLAAVARDVQFLRRNVTDLDKFGFSAKVPVPDFNKPFTIDLALLAIFDAASDCFDAAAGPVEEGASDVETERRIEMRRCGARTHKTIRNLRRLMKSDGGDPAGAAR